MTDFTFTLAEAREKNACVDGYNLVVCYLKGQEYVETYEYIKHDAVVSILDVLESNGIDDALWALRCVKGKDRDMRLFAVWCARQVQHLMSDQRSINALDVAENYANGKATERELSDAWSAAWSAARAASRYAANAAESAATWHAANVALSAALSATARAAARSAARAASSAAARAAQKDMLIKMCNGQAPWQVGENGEPK